MAGLDWIQFAAHAREQIAAAEAGLQKHQEKELTCACGQPLPCLMSQQYSWITQHYTQAMADAHRPIFFYRDQREKCRCGDELPCTRAPLYAPTVMLPRLH